MLEETLLEAAEFYNHTLRLDKSLDYDRLDIFRTESMQDFNAISEMWKLQNLCVHTDFQRRGIGSMMIKWGQEQAEKEGCPIGLESSMVARPVYLKNGFRIYENIHIKDFPLDDVPIFIWEPKGMEGKWGGARGKMIGRTGQ